MIVLGINAYHADASAAIFKDGILIAATEEERFRRIKHWAGFPSLAVQFCLKEAGIGLREVDHIAIGRDPKAKLAQKMLFYGKNAFKSFDFDFVKDRYKNQKQSMTIESELSALSGIPEQEIKPKIHQIEHHRSHMASAFFASPFEESAILSIDGSGDFTTTMFGYGKGNKIEVLDSIDFPHSLGVFYSAFTQLLGFPNYGDEYKVMGLAPYGQPIYTAEMEKIIKWKKNGLFELDMDFFRPPTKGFINYEDHIPNVPALFSDKMEQHFGKAREKHENLTQYHKDVAASVQNVTEKAIVRLLQELHKRVGGSAVCIAGGVAQNSVSNGKLSRTTSFKQIYLPSASHDAGISLGAAMYTYHHLLGNKRVPAIDSAYTGARFTNVQIEKLLQGKNIVYKRLGEEELLDVVTDKIISGGVVGWFQGRAEFGPRALGARSILMDPRRNDAKDLLNRKIKKRESFRPFAPSILREFTSQYFEVDDDVPFMEKVFPIKQKMQKLIPAVTHVDGTGRLQTVDKNTNPIYYRLIETFYKKTGIPILLNTSFNENEPIVNSPAEALDCYLRTSMDMLVMENVVVERSEE